MAERLDPHLPQFLVVARFEEADRALLWNALDLLGRIYEATKDISAAELGQMPGDEEFAEVDDVLSDPDNQRRLVALRDSIFRHPDQDLDEHYIEGRWYPSGTTFAAQRRSGRERPQPDALPSL